MNAVPAEAAGHETVLGDWLMPRTAEAVPGTRHQIRLLTGLVVGYGDLNREIEVMAGELLANTIDHGSGEEARVRVSVTDRVVRVEVYDAGTGPLRQRQADELDERGRGLLIVATLAARWALEQADDGTRAWFEVLQPT